MTKPKAQPQKVSPATRKLKVVELAVDKIKPDPRNARTHSKKQIQALVKAMQEFGFTNPILLKPDGTIGAGHGRFEAAKLAGRKTVPTITIADLTEAQWKAYMLADNQLAIMGSGWDKEMLLGELTSLKMADFDLDLIGFSDFELTKLGVPGFELGDGDGAQTGQLGGMQYSVVIRCKNEAEQLSLLERFQKEGLACETLIS